MGRKKLELNIDEYRKSLRNNEIKKNENGHYVPNVVLLEELKKSRELGHPTDDLARMFTMIATKLSNRMVFKYPEDKEDCISRAVMDCILYWDRFDPNVGENPFAYFSTFCTNGLAKGWNELGYKDIPFSKRVYITDSIYSI